MIDLTAKIVTAYLQSNPLAARDLPDLINTVHVALAGSPLPVAALDGLRQPAVPIKRSVTPEALVCLECGRPQKTLKRHINSAHGLTPDQYRAKWSLAADYPMVAPAYAAHRSQLAIKIGLGRARKGPEPVAAPVPGPASVEAEKPRHHYPASRWSKPSE